MIENKINKTDYFNKRDGIRNYYFEVGDEKDPKVKHPQVKIKAFDNDANLSIRLLDAYEYEIEEPEGSQVNMVAIIPSKPEDPEINYSIKFKNISFHKQPTMDEYQASTGLECYIPSNMEGGYICLHENKNYRGRHKPGYGYGEVFQLPRPMATDSDGKTALCDLHISPKNGFMTVTMPVNFYNSAKYPVRVS